MAETTIVSAPGKVLITGGYLVLNPAYDGTVLATSSRFYTVLSSPGSVPRDTIRVRSPQFLNAEWNYDIRSEPEGDLVVIPSSGSRTKNKFVEIALRETIKVAQVTVPAEAILSRLNRSSADKSGLLVEIVGDNDFYSQRRALENLSLPPTKESLDRLPRFNRLNTEIGDVHKTGLGSSAALITSLVSALLVHLSVISPSTFSHDINGVRRDLDFVHNTSQYIHCLAQGKVGSGFDISSAVYGSQIYKRFDESVLRRPMDETVTMKPEELSRILRDNAAWTCEARSIRLPPRVVLLLADVDAGSDTPSLVGRVLSWRRSSQVEADVVWTSLHEHNRQVASLLKELDGLAQSDPEHYLAGLRDFVKSPLKSMGQGKCLQTMYSLKDTMTAVREGMKAMGQLAGVPIEPDEQSELLDACCAIPGVIGGGVPGAGGYDAIFVLVAVPADDSASNDRDDTVKEILSLWSGWKTLAVSPLLSRAEEGGLRCFDETSQVQGLEHALRAGRRV